MNTFRVKKVSGTYSELLEVYGLSNLLKSILDALNFLDANIDITDRDMFYEVIADVDITDEMISHIHYFPFFKYIKTKVDTNVEQYPDCFDYPQEKIRKKEKNDALQKVYREFQGKEKKEEREQQINKIEDRFPLSPEYDVGSQICAPNNISSFEKLYGNFHNNKEQFPALVKEILSYYSDSTHDSKAFEKKMKGSAFVKSVTATQLYNPNQGQGLNKPKADGLNRKNFDSSWVTETMKISGALSDMVCQLVKVGNSYDLKIFVPEYKKVIYTYKKSLILNFKKYLKGNTPVKIDVLNILLLTRKIVENINVKGKVKNIVSGLHSVYQKDLGQNKAVVNIGFLQVPDFVEVNTKDERGDWLDILDDQRQIIGSIEELGSTVQGLMWYRDFISGSDLDSFSGFLSGMLYTYQIVFPIKNMRRRLQWKH